VPDTKKTAAAAAAALFAIGVLTAAAPAPSAGTRETDQTVRFFNEATGGALDANSSGSDAITWEPNGTAYQDWTVRASHQGYLIESVAKRGNCLQSPANAGDPIRVAPCNPNNPDQHWRGDAVGDRFVLVQDPDRDFAIQATGNGRPVVKAYRDDNPNQLWDVTPA